jgi:alpha-D-ribose 1-methylphosphonate 5-triphosphate diphosphatase
MWLSELKLVLPDRVIEQGALRIQHGRIAEIAESEPPMVAGPVWSLRGLTAIPGIIDMHGDMLEREIEPRPRAFLPYAVALHELDKRLCTSGVTTAYAAVSFSDISITRNTIRREESAREIVEAIHQEREQMLVDMRVHARFEVTNQNAAGMLRTLLDRKQVDLVSLNDHTPGQGQYRDIEKYIKEMAAWRNISDSFAETMTRERIEQAQQRPVAWDVIRDVARIAKAQHVPLASHDDDTPDKIELMADLGVTLSEFPVAIEAARAARAVGMAVAMGAPNALRGVSTSGNLSARDAIAAGVVDMLAADYHPGALLQAAWLLARDHALPLHQAIALVTCNVADGLGLDDRGALAVSKRADIALVDTSSPVPRVRATLREGRVIFADSYLRVESWVLKPVATS